MSQMKMKPRGSFARASFDEALQFRLILAVSFVLCLGAALFARLMPARETGSYSSQRHQGVSIISEARSAAYAAAGYALQR